jgi:uncharacterized protein YsxB (DUF464 family)
MVTKVVVQLDQHNNFTEIVIKDHAGSGDKGHDLVCAAISAITNGTINFLLDQQKKCVIECQPAWIKIKVIKVDPELQLILETMIFQLKNLARNYRCFLRLHFLANSFAKNHCSGK